MVRRVYAVVFLLSILAFSGASCSKLSDVFAIKTWRVVYNGNNADAGTVPVDTQLYTAGSTITIAQNSGGLTKTGNGFVGWSQKQDGTGTLYQPGDGITIGNEDLVFWAVWQLFSYQGNIQVTFYNPENETITLSPDQRVSKSVGLIVNVAEPFDEYRWYLGVDELVGVAGADLSLSLETVAYGPNTLTVFVRRGTLWYSKNLYFIVVE